MVAMAICRDHVTINRTNQLDEQNESPGKVYGVMNVAKRSCLILFRFNRDVKCAVFRIFCEFWLDWTRPALWADAGDSSRISWMMSSVLFMSDKNKYISRSFAWIETRASVDNNLTKDNFLTASLIIWLWHITSKKNSSKNRIQFVVRIDLHLRTFWSVKTPTTTP